MEPNPLQIQQEENEVDHDDDENSEPQERGPVALSAKAFSAKFRGKRFVKLYILSNTLLYREVWNFLTMDCGAYLPPYENVTIYHLRDLVMGTKDVSKSSQLLKLYLY